MSQRSAGTLIGGVFLGIMLVLAAAGILYFQGYRFMHHGPAPAPTERKILCYASPTDPDYYRLEPGKDPQGQDLIPIYEGDPAAPAEFRRASKESKIKYWISPMDPTYVRDKPGKAPCGMDLVPVYEDDAGGETPEGVIVVNPGLIQTMGVRTATVQVQPLSRTIRAVSRVTVNERQLAQVSTKINGWVDQLYIRATEEPVRQGQVLLRIYSPELVSTQQEYLLALKNRRALEKSTFPELQLGAQRLVEAARQRLQLWDIPAAQIDALERAGEISKTLPLHSPVSGIVTKREVTQGQYVTAGQTLLTVADLSTVWVEADVYEYELPWIKVGQSARMTLSYLPGETFQGKVQYIYPVLSGATRTARVRLSFPNPRLRLKPDMFAQVEIQAPIKGVAPVLPVEAILDTGDKQHVFVALGQGRFEPREVKLGLYGEDGQRQVLSGLKGGEEVVTSAQFLLDSESRFREGRAQMLKAGEPGKGDKGPKPMPGHHHH